MSPSFVWACLVGAVALVVLVVALRRGLLYRSSRYVAWRRAKSRRDRGRRPPGGQSDGSGSDPTSGASF